MSASKTIKFFCDNPGANGQLLLSVIPDVAGMFSSCFPVALKVDNITKTGHTEVLFTYTPQYGFGAATPDDSFVPTTNSTVPVDWACTTTLTGNLTFTTPQTGGQTGVIAVTNRGGKANIGAGFFNTEKKTSTFNPVLVYKNIDPPQKVEVAKFKPILKAYTNLFYEEGEIMGIDVSDAVPFWTGNLDEVPDKTEVKIEFNKAKRAWTATEIVPKVEAEADASLASLAAGRVTSSAMISDFYDIVYQPTLEFPGPDAVVPITDDISTTLRKLGYKVELLYNIFSNQAVLRLTVPDSWTCRAAEDDVSGILQRVPAVVVAQAAYGLVNIKGRKYTQWEYISKASPVWNNAVPSLKAKDGANGVDSGDN